MKIIKYNREKGKKYDLAKKEIGMKKGENHFRVLVVGTMIAVIMMGINIVYAHMVKIDEPIFLKHYMECEREGERDFGKFDVNYITNNKDEKRISYISFENGVMAYPKTEEDIRRSYPYDVHRSLLDMRFEGEMEKMNMVNKKLVCNKGDVYFTDGTKMEIEIGEIIIYDIDAIDKNEKEKIPWKLATTNNNGYRSTTYAPVGKIQLIGVKAIHMKEIKDRYVIKIASSIGDTDAIRLDELQFPIEASGEIEISAKEVKEVSKDARIDGDIYFEFLTEDGKSKYIRYHIGDETYFFNDEEIKEIVRSKRHE